MSGDDEGVEGRGTPEGAGDERRRRDRDTVVAVFATILYLALVVCAFGFVSLLADVDVVSRDGTGSLVGTSMVATAVVLVAAALVREARRPAAASTRSRGWAVLVGLAATIGFVGVGVVLVAVESRRWFDGLLFASSTLTSAFPWIAGLLAAAVAGVFALVTAGPSGRPARWSWEAEDDGGD